MQTETERRIATVERKTKETNVFVSLDLDGTGHTTSLPGSASSTTCSSSFRAIR